MRCASAPVCAPATCSVSTPVVTGTTPVRYPEELESTLLMCWLGVRRK
jgi:hypothetical protein